MTKSIVTLQLGNYSNFIGSHYWNLHEFSFENSNNNFVDNDINYYEGSTINNDVTFTPKVISWDWKENLGPRIVDDIYEELEAHDTQSRRVISTLKVNTFKGKIEVNTGFTEEELNVNKTTKINEKQGTDYKEWNEYLYSRFHPNSLTQLPKLYRDFDSGNFKSFCQGLDLTNNLEYFDRMEDQTRSFVEKCDVLQGFQMLCDIDNGFSGVGMNFLTHMADEYNKDIISFPVSFSSENNIDNIFNKIFLFNEMNSKSIFWSPISTCKTTGLHSQFSNINYDPQSKYQTSSILALALKSLSLPCVLNNKSGYTLADYSSLVSLNNNKLVSVGLSSPFPLKEKDTIENSLSNLMPNNVYTNLNSFAEEIAGVNSLMGNIQGIDESRAKNLLGNSNGLYNHCSSVVEVMEHFIALNCDPKNVRFLNSSNSIRLRKPFPRIFSNNVDSFSGELRSSLIDKNYLHCPESLPVSTVIFSNNNSDYLLPLYESAKSALKSRKISTMMMQMEPDYLMGALENFRDLI